MCTVEPGSSGSSINDLCNTAPVGSFLSLQAQHRKHKAEQARLADAHHRMVCLTHTTQAWHRCTEATAPARLQLQALAAQSAAALRQRQLARAFEVWVDRHQGWLVRKVLMGRAVVHYGLAARKKALRRWAAWARMRLDERAAMCAALQHWRTCKCRHALEMWVAWQQDRAQLRYAMNA